MSGWGPICGAILGASIIVALAVGSLTDAVRLAVWALHDIANGLEADRKNRT